MKNNLFTFQLSVWQDKIIMFKEYIKQFIFMMEN